MSMRQFFEHRKKDYNSWLRKYQHASISRSTVKTCLKQPLKKNTKISFQYRLSLNTGQKYCRMLQGEHSAILSTFIKLPFPIKTFVLSIFKWPLKTEFTVYGLMTGCAHSYLKCQHFFHWQKTCSIQVSRALGRRLICVYC